MLRLGYPSAFSAAIGFALGRDQPRYHHVEQERRHRQEDRRQHRAQDVLFLDLVLQHRVRGLILAVGFAAAVARDQAFDGGDHRDL